MTIQQMAIACYSQNYTEREKAWAFFLKKYNNFIYGLVVNRCKKWYHNLDKTELSEVVNDIISDVLLTLSNPTTKSLMSFKAGNDEQKFKLWLGTITYRAVAFHFKSVYLKQERAIQALSNAPQNYENQQHMWALYDYIVFQLRQTPKRRRKIERDIHIFLFSNWNDFSVKTILTLPQYQRFSIKVFENINLKFKRPDFLKF